MEGRNVIGKIDGTGPIRAPQAVRRAAKSGTHDGSSFSSHLDELDDAAPASASSALGSVSGIFGLQEVDDALARAAKGKLRAEDILDKLDGLRLDILSGTMSRDKLLRLANSVNARRHEVSDPRLNELLDEIDLRAQVELAKYDGARG